MTAPHIPPPSGPASLTLRAAGPTRWLASTRMPFFKGVPVPAATLGDRRPHAPCLVARGAVTLPTPEGVRVVARAVLTLRAGSPVLRGQPASLASAR